MGENLLEMNDVSKSFGDVAAVHNINFRVGRNEIVGLLGDNGAGKSTLIKLITGYHQPDTGEIIFDDQSIDHLTVAQARDLGIETVYQERALAEQQPLWRNIFMGRELTEPLRPDGRQAHEAGNRPADAGVDGLHVDRSHLPTRSSRPSPAGRSKALRSPERCISRPS